MISVIPYQHVFFTGIGGCSMSGLAETLAAAGHSVSGSDNHQSVATDRLLAQGIPVFIGHRAENLPTDADLLVYTVAVHADNPELLAARSRGIPIMERGEFLGLLMTAFPKPVCVSGTHGKTSTTSMITSILLDAGYDPSAHVGAIVDAIGGSWRLGRSPYFVAESDEYHDSFLWFHAFAAVIINVEYEHPDYFKDLDHMLRSYHTFASNIDPEGFLIINASIQGLEKVTAGLACRVLTFGTPDAQYRHANLAFDSQGFVSFDAYERDTFLCRVGLRVRGAQMATDALAALACAKELGVPRADIPRSLSQFGGAHRRFEIKGQVNGVTVADDYAHHPTEIGVNLLAAKQAGYRRVHAIFQPHTFSRTKTLLPELAAAFADADTVTLMDIYAAREQDPGDIHSRDLLTAMRALTPEKDIAYFSNREDIVKRLFEIASPGDLFITLGAGDVTTLGDLILQTGLSTSSTAPTGV